LNEDKRLNPTRNQTDRHDEDPRQPSLTTGSPGGQLTIQFQFCDDRFHHQIGFQVASEFRPLMRSLESIDQKPASPPLQEIVTEVHGQAPVLLAVGQADRNHWSGAISKLDAESRIQMEFACRVNNNTGWLGSTYQVDPECQVELIGENRFATGYDDRKLLLSAAQDTQLGWNADQRTLSISPIAEMDQIPATLIWNYSVAMTVAGP